MSQDETRNVRRKTSYPEGYKKGDMRSLAFMRLRPEISNAKMRREADMGLFVGLCRMVWGGSGGWETLPKAANAG